MTYLEEAEKYLALFLDQIKKFNLSLTNFYQLTFCPTYNEAGNLFPRNGELDLNNAKINYRFHGRGCTFQTEGIIVSYDIDVLHNNEIIISRWKFLEFIKSSSRNSSSIELKDLLEIFTELVKKGALLQRKNDVLEFNINENYFNTKSQTLLTPST